MSHQESAPLRSLVGTQIDSLEFARKQGSIEGSIAVAALPRLADVVVGENGDVTCRVTGDVDGEGRSYLHLAVSGRLGLRCQRCLQPLAWSLDLHSDLRLMVPGEAWPDDDLADDDSDPIAAESAQALLPLVEDEILLALPIAPRHEACELLAPAQGGADRSPFAVLAQLKKQG